MQGWSGQRDLHRGNAAQVRDRGRASKLREGDAVRLLLPHERDRVRLREVVEREAHRDRAMKQPGRHRAGQQIVHGVRAARLARDGDARGIAAKRRDILLHPAQRGNQVQQSVGAARVMGRFGGQFGMAEACEQAEPVVGGHDDEALFRKRRRLDVARAPHPGPTVDVEQHRVAIVGGLRRRPHIEEQAVLAHVGRLLAARARRLRTARPERIRGADALPRNCRLRLPPAQLADGRCRERNALEGHHLVPRMRDPFDHTRRGMHGRARLPSARAVDGEENQREAARHVHGVSINPFPSPRWRRARIAAACSRSASNCGPACGG
jgi:hypothetical protein